MRPFTPNTNKGRTWAGDDIHHKTADQPARDRGARAKSAKHAARQDGQRQIDLERAHELESKLKAIQEEQDRLLTPHAQELMAKILATPSNASPGTKQALSNEVQKFPYGFYRSELVTALHRTFGIDKN